MVRRNVARMTACCLGVALALAAAIATAAVDGRIDDVVRVENLQSSADTVRGRIVNETNDALEDVRLVISDRFLWRNERHPGENSPSTAHSFTVRGPVPPHGSIPFEFRRPDPLPDRPDGRFTTDVTAIELTCRPIVAGGSYETRTYDRRTYDRRTYNGPARDE